MPFRLGNAERWWLGYDTKGMIELGEGLAIRKGSGLEEIVWLSCGMKCPVFWGENDFMSLWSLDDADGDSIEDTHCWCIGKGLEAFYTQRTSTRLLPA